MSRIKHRRSINAKTTARIAIPASCAGMIAAISAGEISPTRAKTLPTPVHNRKVRLEGNPPNWGWEAVDRKITYRVSRQDFDQNYLYGLAMFTTS
jgi:hypothetical protein